MVDGHKPLASRRLRARHFLYELIEDTNTKKREPIKVLLKTSVEGKSILLMEDLILSGLP